MAPEGMLRRMTSSSPPSPWKILVVEDDARTRRFFAACVEASPQLALAGLCSSVAEARIWLGEAQEAPDALLTDLGLPDGSGVDVIRETLAKFPGCEALVVSMFGDEEHVMAAIEAGALGYVHKDSLPESVAQTIIDLKNGASPISPGIARRLLTRLGGGASPAARADAAAGEAGLTARETEILDFLARGFSYAEIAHLCNVKRNTVATHVKSLYRKMHVGSRAEAVFEGLQSGVIRPLGVR